MIVVTGSITATADSFDHFRTAALEHVRRSRAEDGCLSHEVAVDAENPLRLVFLERWRDLAALQAHFRVPASGAFVADIRARAAAFSGPDIYPVADEAAAPK